MKDRNNKGNNMSVRLVNSEYSFLQALRELQLNDFIGVIVPEEKKGGLTSSWFAPPTLYRQK